MNFPLLKRENDIDTLKTAPPIKPKSNKSNQLSTKT